MGAQPLLNGINIEYSLTTADTARQSLKHGWKLGSLAAKLPYFLDNAVDCATWLEENVSQQATHRSAMDNVGAIAWRRVNILATTYVGVQVA